MKIILEQTNHSFNRYRMHGIGQAFLFHGHESTLWNRRDRSVIDMIDEQKPHVVFYNEPLTKASQDIAAENGILLVPLKMVPLPVCDPLAFKPLPKSNLFDVASVCVVNFPEFENKKPQYLLKKMSIENKESFRLFSPIQDSNSKYCGNVPQELLSTILSSAKEVIAISQASAINAKLCNSNVVLVNPFKDTHSAFDMPLQDCLRCSFMDAIIEWLPSEEDKEQARKKNNEYFQSTFGVSL